MGTCSLANLCSRTVESVGLNYNVSLTGREGLLPSLPLTPLESSDYFPVGEDKLATDDDDDMQQIKYNTGEQYPTPRKHNGLIPERDAAPPSNLEDSGMVFEDDNTFGDNDAFGTSFSSWNDESEGDNGDSKPSFSFGDDIAFGSFGAGDEGNGSAEVNSEQGIPTTQTSEAPNNNTSNAHSALGQKPRIQMFGSEYARILSSSRPLSNTNDAGSRSLKTSIKARLTSSVSAATSYASSIGHQQQQQTNSVNAKESVDAGAGNVVLTLDECSNSVATAAITDVVVTSGSDVPPRGYYRTFQLGEETSSSAMTKVPGTRKRQRFFLNVKKEPNWDRAVQRPCVTAICVIYPDRNEFVPPGFSVVRLFQPNANKGVGASSLRKEGGGVDCDFGSSASPANINTSSGERVYLCYRRSREGNPITGIACLRPSKGDLIPDGYTVLERTPRNFLADMSPKSDHPMFLAYRQRLENLECLRPLPLVLSIIHSKQDGTRKELKSYYCTGGTVVASDVGKLHIMDRSTHSLLSSSSAQSRMTLIQLSRKESGAVPNWVSSASSQPSNSRPNSRVGTPQNNGGDSTSASSFETPHESTTFSKSASHDSLSSFGTAATSRSSPTPASPKYTSPKYSGLFSHSDDTLQSCFDAMHFIPPIECAQSAVRMEDSSFLQSRVTVITPILTACYTSQGGSALIAVDGLTSLLNDTAFFEPDESVLEGTIHGIVDSSVRLTLLDLAIQVVCDVATSSARETYFRSCVDFVSDAVRYAGGKLNDRTTGFVLRFYLFVFYFGASIPSSGWPFSSDWNESKTGMTDDFLLSDNLESKGRDKQSLVGVYLPGGAPHAAALALKEFVTIMLGRLGTGTCATNSTDHASNSQSVAREVVSDIVESSMNRVDVVNYTQLALYQIHRSGGSELFWHDMINSCGTGLFGQDTSSSLGIAHANIISFAILTSFVKISSGKVRVISNNAEPVPRDVASKLLSLELLLSFVETWHIAVQAEDTEQCTEATRTGKFRSLPFEKRESMTTMVYVIRRLVVPTLLSNTSAALEDCRVFRRVLRIISHLWCTPYYRRHMKIDLAVLFEHFVLKLLCLGPQVQRSLGSIGGVDERETTSSSDMPSLLHQQIDVLEEMNVWFSSDPKEVLYLYFNYDVDQSGSLPTSYSKLTSKICEALCNLAEKCGSIISEHGRFASINGANSSPRKSVVSPREGDVSDMTHVRETALVLREKSFAVITSIAKSMMECSSIAQTYEKTSFNEPDTEDQSAAFALSPQLSPAPNARSEDDDIVDYWHTSIERRKAPLQPLLIVPSSSQGIPSFESETPQSLSIKNSRSEDSSKYALSQQKKESLDVAFEIISSKGLKKGLDYLIACHLLTPSPRDVSSFLRIHQSSIDPVILGEYLGEGGIDGADKDYWNQIRFNYARAISFVGMNVEQA